MFEELELEVARQLLLDSVKKIDTERVFLHQAHSRYLVQNVYAPMDVPGFSKSTMDGFALRALDTEGASKEKPISIRIIGEVKAGDTEVIKLPRGCGVKIFTGAPLPGEADVVVKKENVFFQNGEILLTYPLKKNKNIVFRGSDFKEGEKIFSDGERLSPYHLGVLAALGLKEVPVFIKPRVGLISTGSELVSPDKTLAYGQIYNSNLFTLQALIEKWGGQGQDFGIVKDQCSAIRKALYQALEHSDLVITTGGVSVGDYDLVERVLREEKAEILFTKIGIKPGSHVIAGILENKLVIGLSGNPAAAFMSFDLLVRPLLKKLSGAKDLEERYLEVELAEGFTKASPQRRFLRTRVIWEKGKWIAYQTGNNNTGILKTMLGYNALVDIPKGSGPLAPNTSVKALVLEEMLCYHP